MIITGVGSRAVTELGIKRIKDVCRFLNKPENILRSGAADGCDSIFEEELYNCKQEIFLPWKGFRKHKSELYDITNEAYNLASSVHPIFFKLKIGAKKLHARNMYQVLGYDLNKPSDILICWTKDECYNEDTCTPRTGGTRSAIVLASRNNIPVYNLNIDSHYESLLKWLSFNN